MTFRIYYGSKDLETNATVVDIGEDSRGKFVILDRTIAHVKGGGAKSDRGTIGTTEFHDVVAPDGRTGAVRHYIELKPAFSVGDTVEVIVDPQWRATQSAYHSAGHLIAAVVEARNKELAAVSGHHYPGESRVEFSGDAFPDLDDLVTNLEYDLKEAIERDLKIATVGDPQTNRKVRIGDYEPVPCGGVHVSSTKKLVDVSIKNVKVKRGKLRISYEVNPAA